MSLAHSLFGDFSKTKKKNCRQNGLIRSVIIKVPEIVNNTEKSVFFHFCGLLRIRLKMSLAFNENLHFHMLRGKIHNITHKRRLIENH